VRYVGQISNACKNLTGQNIWSPEKCPLVLVNNEPLGLFCLWTKVYNFSPNVEEVVVDQGVFRFELCRSIPEIFAIKVESCQKSRRILDVFFALPNYRGQAFQKLYPFYHPCLAARAWKSFVGIFPLSPKL